jgi:hypothetical protein
MIDGGVSVALFKKTKYDFILKKSGMYLNSLQSLLVSSLLVILVVELELDDIVAVLGDNVVLVVVVLRQLLTTAFKQKQKNNFIFFQETLNPYININILLHSSSV